MIGFIKAYMNQFKTQWLIHSLSILGLAIGLSVALLLGWWSLKEFSFDKFFSDGDKIYRVGREGFLNNETVRVAICYGPLAREAKAHFPEIDISTNAVYRVDEDIKKDDIKVKETVLIADSNFLDILDYPILNGNTTNFLSIPNSILITEELAKKLFPNEDPIGKVLEIREAKKEITGILKDIPSNSHLQFAAILPMNDFPNIMNNEWLQNDEYMTYIKLYDGVNIEDLAEKLTLLTQELEPVLKDIPVIHFIQPLYDIHFGSSNFRFDNAISGNMNMVLVLFFMGVIILIIACINFTNLFVSTAFLRAKSLAIKKTNGAQQWQLIRDFYLETIISVAVSLIIGIILAVLLLPIFNELSNSNIELSFADINLYFMILVFAIFTIVIAGSVPAFSMSKMDLIQSLKGQIKGRKVSVFQKALIVVQFSASIILLIAVFSIQHQIQFMKNKELGFDIDQILYVQAFDGFSDNYVAIKQELERHSSILEVTAKKSLPMDWSNGNAISLPDSGADPYIMETCATKINYFNMMDIAIVEGEEMQLHHENKNYVWLNEQAVDVLLLEEPIGKQVSFNEELFEIKGVVKDVYSKSLHLNIDPQVYYPSSEIYSNYVLLIKTTEDVGSAIDAVKSLWEKYNPKVDFEYNFLDSAYENLYEADERASKIVGFGMLIAILLTLIGTFAMATYASERRTKEIGIRKVNGAKVYEILILLNRDFLKFILISFIIAIPMAYYLMNRWLEGFANRTDLSWWIFIQAGLIVLFISLITISWRSFKAATRNPIESLRYE